MEVIRAGLDTGRDREAVVRAWPREARHQLTRFFVECTTYAPSEPPEDQLDEGEGQEGGQVSAGFSKSLARRRLRPNQETQSTTRRRGGETKPFVSSLRLTI